jgi:hypothetical protein
VHNIKIDLLEIGWGGVDWIVSLRVGTSGELMWMRLWTFGFHKMLGNCQVATQLVASRAVFSSIELELVSYIEISRRVWLVWQIDAKLCRGIYVFKPYLHACAHRTAVMSICCLLLQD